MNGQHMTKADLLVALDQAKIDRLKTAISVAARA